MILEMFVASPNVAEAKSEGIKRGTLKEITVAANEDPLTITLYDPSKPENTKVVSSTVPSWITVTKTSYYSASFTVKFQKNTSSSRTATIQFTEGSYIWYAKITQNKPTPTPTPKPKKSSNNGSKNNTPSKGSTPTPKATPVPTSTPTPIPGLTTSATALNFRADGETKTVTISGYSGALRADRGDTWFTASVSGGTISVTATKNTGTARTSYLDVTDTGSGHSVRIQVNQAAPIYNPEPTKVPTNTPTPTPAEILPVKTKKLQFGAQGGQDTLTLDGKGYNLRFSYPDNPSVPTGWVTMSYENGKIIVKAKQNKNHAPRSMKVTITDINTNQYAYVTINQKAAPTPTPTPYLKIYEGENSVTVSYKSARESVTLDGVRGKLYCEYTWAPTTVTNWVHDVPVKNQVAFVVDTNLDINPREATIRIIDEKTSKAVTYTIMQEGMPNTAVVSNTVLKPDKGNIQFDSTASSTTIRVNGKKGTLRITRGENDDWYTAEVDGNEITIKAKVNSGEERIGYLDIIDTGNGQQTRVTITQKGIPVISKENSKTLYVIAQGDTLYAAINSTDLITKVKYENDVKPEWLTIIRQGNTCKIEVKANKSADVRKTVIELVTGLNSNSSTFTLELIQKGAVVFDRNYVGAPADVLCRYPQSGQNFGSLPSPGNRPGFEFDGWYTSPSGGERIGASTKYEGTQNTYYAHWKVIVSFPDSEYLAVQYHETSAQEGALITIPSPIIRELEYYGFHVSGWTRNPSGHKIDNGNAYAYQLPKNLGGSKVTLYAINTEGKTFAEYAEKHLKNSFVAGAIRTKNMVLDGLKDFGELALNLPGDKIEDLVAAVTMKEANEDETPSSDKKNVNIIGNTEIHPGVKTVILESLSPKYDKDKSAKNREVNEAMVKDLKENRGELGGYINGQKRVEIMEIKVGDMTLGQAGCGIIACYNALYGCGVDPSLPEIISLAETEGYLWGTGEGLVDAGLSVGGPGDIAYDFAEDVREREADNFTGFGVNPYNVDNILKSYGVSSKMITSRYNFFLSLNDAIRKGKKKRYIVDYWVISGGEIYSQHYIYIETTGKTNGNTIMICNDEMMTKESKYTDVKYLEEELTEKGINLFIIAYEIKG